MFSAEKIDLNKQEHGGFIFDLINACRDELLDDFDNDELLLIQDYKTRMQEGTAVGFIVKRHGEYIGAIWVDVYSDKTGKLFAALMPGYRNGKGAFHFLGQFIQFCFNDLNLRKLTATTRFRGKKKCTPERLLRKFGFSKSGIDNEATIVGGLPVDHLVLALTKTKYNEARNEKQKKQQQETASRASAAR